MNVLFFLFACSSTETNTDKDQAFKPGLGSGGAFQDPSGFPAFHSQPAPPGPPIQGLGKFSKPIQLTQQPSGGYRPQIVVGKNDESILRGAINTTRCDGKSLGFKPSDSCF